MEAYREVEPVNAFIKDTEWGADKIKLQVDFQAGDSLLSICLFLLC